MHGRSRTEVCWVDWCKSKLTMSCQRDNSILKMLLNRKPVQNLQHGLKVTNQHSIFFFPLIHQRADDEALTKLLQTSLFLVVSPILVKSIFFSFRSSLTLSIQISLCFSFPPHVQVKL